MHNFNLEINKLIRKKTNHRGIDSFLFCPHQPSENCNCRKPKNLLIKKALKKFDSDAEESILIGDKMSDYEAGVSTGIKSFILCRDNENDSQELNYPNGIVINSLVDPKLKRILF